MQRILILAAVIIAGIAAVTAYTLHQTKMPEVHRHQMTPN